MYNIIYETSYQSRFDARYWMLGAGALGRPRGMVWGRRRDRGWDGWMTSLTWWTWVWARSRSWCWIGKPGVLQSTVLQSDDWTTSLVPWNKSMTNLQHIQKQKHHFADKGLYSQSHDISSSHVQMWEVDHKEGWALKKGCFWIAVLEKTLESPLDSKEIKPVNPKGNQPCIPIGRTVAEALILWPPHAKSWLIGKDPDARKDWRQ